ncbi:MAG: 3-deoxy-7-phosphoheptulonate synthase [Methylacidiphilales bacterium]|nr:3-deoxy-7-phosphoheptulonate synthase [Candidatus Methylacidiphilales bacterium]
MSLTPVQNLHVREVSRLISPAKLNALHPANASHYRQVTEHRTVLQNILSGRDKRMLVIVGPCSIHDPKAAMEYATKLNVLRKELESRLYIVMRVYFEKPRTTIGWKGLIYDPALDGSEDIDSGLRIARKLLLEITELGLPASTEFLDPIVPQYITDLISWAAIGARTTESQTHRQMASGLSMPVGYKNSTDGSLQVAIDALGASMHPHSFLGIDADGFTSIIRTTGNPWGHIVLRGGNKRTNYDADSIRETQALLKAAGLPPVVMVDCSHANSGKVPARQEDVWNSVLQQRAAGNDNLVGMMLESYLEEGSQKIPEDKTKLKYGVSITDPCISWPTTERLLRGGYEMLKPV